MNTAIIKTVYKKELVHVLRDFETLFVMLILPFLLYPIIAIGMGEVTVYSVSKISDSPSRLLIQDNFNNTALVQFIQNNKKITVLTEGTDEDLASKKVDAILKLNGSISQAENSFSTTDIKILYNGTSHKSLSLVSDITDILFDYRDMLSQMRIKSQDLPKTFGKPLKITKQNVVKSKKMSGYWFGLIFPMIFIVLCTVSIYPAAIDLTAGEKDHRTIETLFTFPAQRSDIVIGKYLAVITIGFISVSANLLSILTTVKLILSIMKSQKLFQSMHFNLALSAKSLLISFCLTVPFILFAAGTMMAVCSWARSYRDAQNYLSPVLILCMLPPMINLVPGFDFSVSTALIPVGSLALAFRELFQDKITLLPIVISFSVHIFLAALMLIVTLKFFTSEMVMFRQNSSFTLMGGELNLKKLSPVTSLSLFAAVFVLFFLIAPILQTQLNRIGLMIIQFFIVLAPALILWKYSGESFSETFSDKKLGLKNMLLIFPYTVSAFMITSSVTFLISFFFPVSEQVTKALMKALACNSTAEYAGIIFIAGVMPAFCEEMLFRGAILSGFMKKMKPYSAVLLTGFLFGVLHLSIYRFIPTMMLGIFMGILVIRTNSIRASMLMHFLNNTSLLSLQYFFMKNTATSASNPQFTPAALIILLVIMSGCSAFLYAITRFMKPASDKKQADLDPEPVSD